MLVGGKVGWGESECGGRDGRMMVGRWLIDNLFEFVCNGRKTTE